MDWLIAWLHIGDRPLYEPMITQSTDNYAQLGDENIFFRPWGIICDDQCTNVLTWSFLSWQNCMKH